MHSLIVMSALLAGPPGGPDPFTTEGRIFAVSRSEGGFRPVKLTEAIEALTTWRKVSEWQYNNYHHKIGATGSVTLRGGESYLWSIQPGYAGRVVDSWGRVTYLLHPALKVEQPPKAR